MRALLVALITLAAPLHAQEVQPVSSPELEYFNYGILCYYSDAAPDVPLTNAQIDAISQSGGLYDDVRADQSLKIPGISGVIFGVLSNFPEGISHEARSIITHTRPSGRVTRDPYDFTITDIFEIDGWQLEIVNEDALGTYRFQTLRGEDTLYDVTFEVVPAEGFSNPVPDCVEQL